MAEINPRYTAYAKAHGNNHIQQALADELAYPGGVMCGFILWIQDKLLEFNTMKGYRGTSLDMRRLYSGDEAEFDEFIGVERRA